MQPFRKHTGVVVPLDKVNVDTDQIIPKQFLKRIERTGLASFSFMIGAFRATGKRSTILCCMRRATKGLDSGRGEELRLRVLARTCRVGAGGLRLPGGDRIVVCRHLCQQQPEEWPADGAAQREQVAEIMRRSKEIDNYRLTSISKPCAWKTDEDSRRPFAMDEFSRHCLLNGLDDIGLTLQHEAEIAAYEAKHPVGAEWAIL
jgi:3-isopropylmalate/(R)-2-methylmalate dehydratase small subunit